MLSRLSFQRFFAIFARCLAVSLVFSGFLHIQLAAAGSTPPSSDKAQQLQNQIGEASKEETAALNQIQAVRNQLAAANAQLATANAKVGASQARVNAENQKLAEIEAQVAALATQVNAVQEQADAAKNDVRTDTQQMYKRASIDVPLSLSTGTGDVNKDLVINHYLKTASRKRKVDEKIYFKQLDALSEQRKQLAVSQDQANQARTEAEAERNQLAQLQTQQKQARDAVAAQEASQNALLQSVRAKKADYERQLAALQADSNAIANRLRQGQAGQGSSVAGSGFFKRPVSAAITSTFGPRVHPIFGDIRVHTGIDFGASYGTPVKAAGSGTVIWATSMTGYGNVVIINHGNGLATLYAHLSSIGVGNGQRVQVGQTVGAVGQTGYATGPHLHFEVRVNGTPVDPMRYL